ncbi:MAG: hypothetical protein AAB373_03360 [Patescibacteria group bacterium]
MQKICKKCSKSFEISSEDLEFYKKVAVNFGDKAIEMPSPTFCPDCRNQRRMMFRNDRVFYHRKCDLSGKQFISIYSSKSNYKVYQPSEWYSDKWDAMDYGRDFDFSRPFFEQFNELMLAVPRLGIDLVNCENSDYCNYCGDDKDCYLDIAGEANRDCYFNLFVKYSSDVVDSTFVYKSELCYECINCYECYNAQHCIYCENCSDVYFCFDLKGCRNCIFSHGLRDQEYCIFNKKYSKEDYEVYVKKLDLGSFLQREKLREGWMKFRKENDIFSSNYQLNCENCSGDDLKNCKNTFHSFNALNCEDCAYLFDVLDAKDCRDLNYSLYKPELSYELISTLSMTKSAFCMASHYCNEVFYCDLTNNSNNLFGCIGLRHKQYCILNKQYSREEYEALLPKIIDWMRQTGEWGEFFTASISPFAYEETVAMEYFPIQQKEESQQNYLGPDYQIPDSIRDVDQELCKKILKCQSSSKFYKVIPAELKFYQKMKIPIPRKSSDQRHKDRIDLRNSRKIG